MNDSDDSQLSSSSNPNFDESIVIEEITTENLAESELSQFIPVCIPDPVVATTSSKRITAPVKNEPSSTASTTVAAGQWSLGNALPVEQEEILIKKLMNGEMTFGDYNMQIGQIVDDNINDPDEIDDEEMLTRNIEVSNQFEAELLQSRRDAIRGNLKGRPVGRDGKMRKRCVLPVALQGLMGEANLSYARGRADLAEKACLEIIRQVPLAAEPFLTLAQIYEANTEKYMQFSLIAAHLNPSDIDQWVRIAELSLEQGNVKQAINCYMKATKNDPKNNDLRLRRIKLLKQIGEERLAFRVYCSMLANIPPDETEFVVATAKYIANHWLSEKQPQRALSAMNIAYGKCGENFPTEDINFYLELLIDGKQFKTVLRVLETHSGLQITTSSDESSEYVTAVDIPDGIILDFRSKLIVSLIHLHCFNLLEQLFANIFQFIDVETAGDCYLDIAEALMVEQKYEEALRLLEPLLHSRNFSMAAVWLRHADCQRALGNIEEAIESYRHVVQLAPLHYDARLTLSALLKQMGRSTDAMAALEQDLENELVDPFVLYERCYMLQESGKLDEFVECGLKLLSRHCCALRNVDEMVIATTIVKYSAKVPMIRECRSGKSEPLDDPVETEFAKSENEPTVDMEWRLYQDIVRTAYELNRFALMQKITFTMMTCRRFWPFSKEMEFNTILSSLYNRNGDFAFRLVKDMLEKNLHSVRMWNFFNLVIQFTETVRYGRYLFRLFKRINLHDLPLLVMRANYFLMSGSLKYAVNDYTVLYKRQTNDPLIPLMLSITLSHMAQQKHIQKRENLLTQSMTFVAKYREHREQIAYAEVHYNLGRMYQTFGTLHLAVVHYKKVLDDKCDFFQGENEPLLGLKQEAAFNLHLIYSESGNWSLARKVLHDYITI